MTPDNAERADSDYRRARSRALFGDVIARLAGRRDESRLSFLPGSMDSLVDRPTVKQGGEGGYA